MTSIADYLVPEGVLIGLSPENAEGVIGHLADHLTQTGNVAASWAGAAVAREAVMPTGLPLGEGLAVAVPHTDPEHVVTSGVAVAVLTKPVEFGSMDDPDEKIAVQVVVALALKDKNEQIEMLKAVITLLQDETRLRGLIGAQDAAAARALLGSDG